MDHKGLVGNSCLSNMTLCFKLTYASTGSFLFLELSNQCNCGPWFYHCLIADVGTCRTGNEQYLCSHNTRFLEISRLSAKNNVFFKCMSTDSLISFYFTILLRRSS